MAVWRSDFYGRSYSISQFNSSNFLSWRSLASLFSARARAVTVDVLSDGINERRSAHLIQRRTLAQRLEPASRDCVLGDVLFIHSSSLLLIYCKSISPDSIALRSGAQCSATEDNISSELAKSSSSCSRNIRGALDSKGRRYLSLLQSAMQ